MSLIRNGNDLIHTICDCVVKGNVPGLTQQNVNKLARHKTSLIKLTEKVPTKRKEKGSCSERWWISSIFTSSRCSLNS